MNNDDDEFPESWLMTADGLRVSVNPKSLSQALVGLRLPSDFLSAGLTATTGALRVLADLDTKSLYVWPAGDETHAEIAMYLGVENFAKGLATNNECNLEISKGLEERRAALEACRDKVRALFGHLKTQ